MTEKTIFAKIIAGELPATKIYEDDTVLAFLDINPIQPGHTLVIPKTASTDVRQTDPTDLAHLMTIAQNIAIAQTNSLDCDGVNIFCNCGTAAGQEVFHTHIHVVPRWTDDGVLVSAKHSQYKENEAATVASQITAALDKL